MKSLFYIYISLITFLFISCGSKTTVRINEPASAMLNNLPENPLSLNIITTLIDGRQNTISNIYGNDVAFMHLQKDSDSSKYPTGTVLYRVTWRRVPDSVWFGARTPGNLLYAERVTIKNDHTYSYAVYSSPGVQKTEIADTASQVKEIAGYRLPFTP